MKTTKIYLAPRTEVCKTRVRMNILAGSGNAINGVSGGNTSVPGMSWDSDNAINGASSGNVRVPNMPWDNGARARASID